MFHFLLHNSLPVLSNIIPSLIFVCEAVHFLPEWIYVLKFNLQVTFITFRWSLEFNSVRRLSFTCSLFCSLLTFSLPSYFEAVFFSQSYPCGMEQDFLLQITSLWLQSNWDYHSSCIEPLEDFVFSWNFLLLLFRIFFFSWFTSTMSCFHVLLFFDLLPIF